MKPDYTYNAQIVRVIDGDSLEVIVDCGFRLSIRTPVRLAHINTPELNQAGGSAAKQHLSAIIGGTSTVMRTFKPYDKYGRWLAEVYVDGRNINQQMVDDGYAVSYEGG